MPSFSNVTLQLGTATANGIVTSQTLGAAGTLTLDGALVSGGVATLDVARRVIITSAGNDSGIDWVLAGGNRNGVAQSETISGASTAAAESVLDYKTVTSITGSGATASTVTAGTNGTGSTEWVLDNPAAPYFAVSVGVHILSGTATFTVEHTYDDPNAGLNPGNSAGVAGPQDFSIAPGSNVPPVAWPDATANGKTADVETSFIAPVMAHRLTITAGAGNVIMQSIQAGIGSP